MKSALVFGASGGIGLAITKSLLENQEYSIVFATYRSLKTELTQLQKDFPERLHCMQIDAADESQYQNLTRQIQQKTDRLHLCIHTVGTLSTDQSPERSMSEVGLENMTKTFQTNAVSFLLLAKALKSILRKTENTKLIAISAKVGSIQENELGGWHSYRMSKAALNMGVKNISIELGRLNPSSTTMSLHPGTTETSLSTPFLDSARKKYIIHSPQQTAQNLLHIIQEVTPKTHNGRFFS